MSELADLLSRASKGAGLTKMQDLKILEISGVDFPASELDGWMVRKARHQAARKAGYQAACKAAQREEGAQLLRAKLEELAGITPERKAAPQPTPPQPSSFLKSFRHGGPSAPNAILTGR